MCSGADIYFLRHILHNWPDSDCISILRNLIKEMVPGKSKLLVCDYVVPDQSPNRYKVHMDITMAMLFGGSERTGAQFEALFSKTDERLNLIKVWSENGVDILELELAVFLG